MCKTCELSRLLWASVFSGWRAHQKLTANAFADVAHALQKLREKGMKPGGQDFVDAAVLQLGQQFARLSQGLDRKSVV